MLTALVHSFQDAADAAKKQFDKYMFLQYFYQRMGGASGCVKAMSKVYPGFDERGDAEKVAEWLGLPCGSEHGNESETTQIIV